MKTSKNRISSFDLFVRLDEQLNTGDDASVKMIKAKLKSAAYNASSALSLMGSNPGVQVDPYILAQIAVAADYLEKIEEFFRNFEGGEEAGLPAPGGDDMMPAPEGDNMPAPSLEGDEEGEGDEMTDDTEEPGETNDDETEDEVEDSPEEEQEEE